MSDDFQFATIYDRFPADGPDVVVRVDAGAAEMDLDLINWALNQDFSSQPSGTSNSAAVNDFVWSIELLPAPVATTDDDGIA